MERVCLLMTENVEEIFLIQRSMSWPQSWVYRSVQSNVIFSYFFRRWPCYFPNTCIQHWKSCMPETPDSFRINRIVYIWFALCMSLMIQSRSAYILIHAVNIYTYWNADHTILYEHETLTQQGTQQTPQQVASVCLTSRLLKIITGENAREVLKKKGIWIASFQQRCISQTWKVWAFFPRFIRLHVIHGFFVRKRTAC